MAEHDNAVLGDPDPGPIQLMRLDYTWTAVAGLVANIRALADTIDEFPAGRWYHGAVLHGRTVAALELANYGVHEAVHHLVDLDRLGQSTP